MASLVTNDNIYPHTADLKNPQLVVCVEVIKVSRGGHGPYS